MLNTILQPYSVLIGQWKTVGSHPQLPGRVLNGHVSFAWIEDGAFLLMRSVTEDPEIPDATAIFGSNDADGAVSMLYFDERGVSRIFSSSLQDATWRFWRMTPGFSQRATGTLAPDGGSMHLVFELMLDDKNWARDLESTYTRV